MNESRVLTEAENVYLQELCVRQIHIQKQIAALMKRDMREVHAETGLRNWHIWSLLCEAAGWVDLELVELIS